MNNKKTIKEFKDDSLADKAISGVTSSLTRIASTVTNTRDFSRVIEAIAKWLQNKKGSQLSSLDTNQNYKMMMKYLNMMQSDQEKNPEKSSKETSSTTNPFTKK